MLCTKIDAKNGILLANSLQQVGISLLISKSVSASVLSHSVILQGCGSTVNVFNFYFHVAGTVSLAGESEGELH